MCFTIDRRSMLKLIASASTASVLRPFLPAAVTSLVLPSRLSSVADLVLGSSEDNVDRYPDYLRGTDMSEWHSEIHPVLKSVVPQLLRASSGAVVELGSYEGVSLQVLQSVFPTSKVIALDIHPYHQSPNLVIGDIRKNPLPDQPIKVGWNDISSWKNSPRSKLAAFNYLKRNLVKGGLYIDDAFGNLPHDIDLSGLELVYSKGYVSIFRKA